MFTMKSKQVYNRFGRLDRDAPVFADVGEDRYPVERIVAEGSVIVIRLGPMIDQSIFEHNDKHDEPDQEEA